LPVAIGGVTTIEKPVVGACITGTCEVPEGLEEAAVVLVAPVGGAGAGAL
jgi:hypothetical protein